jgi:hypothetical protein
VLVDSLGQTRGCSGLLLPTALPIHPHTLALSTAAMFDNKDAYSRFV